MTHRPEYCTGPNCGAPIVWGRDEQGTLVALDPSIRVPVYNVLSSRIEPDGTFRVAIAGRRGNPAAMVAHAAVCPDRALLNPDRTPGTEIGEALRRARERGRKTSRFDDGDGKADL